MGKRGKKVNLSDLDRFMRPRQLRLDLWLAAYHMEHERLFDRWLRFGRPDDFAMAQRELDRIEADARAHADRVCLYEDCPSWRTLRKLIYDRDEGMCWCCGEYVSPTLFHLGHLVEQWLGGPDLPHNLVVMCRMCNQAEKPFHDTIDDAIAWRNKTCRG